VQNLHFVMSQTLASSKGHFSYTNSYHWISRAHCHLMGLISFFPLISICFFSRRTVTNVHMWLFLQQHLFIFL